MSRRLTLIVILTLILVAVIAAPALAQTPAPSTKQVGLVIAFPDGTRHIEIVTVPTAATTFEVLEAADIDLASQSTQFGPAICNINGTGCPAEDCFCNAEEYWAYYHLANGQWASASEGVGTFVPANRAVEGFAWSGFDANFNPLVQPPVLTFDQIVAQTTPPPTSIPEPMTLLLLAGGVAGLAAYARRKRQA